MEWLETEIHREYHEVSNIFPLLEGEEFEALVVDIAENGLLEPIWLDSNGLILDGRNRHRACIEAGTEPQFRIWLGKGSLISFVASMNLYRRHLTASRRATVAANMIPIFQAEARERQRGGQGGTLLQAILPEAKSDKGLSRDKVAEIMNVSSGYVRDSLRLKREAPELFDEVDRGNMNIPQAMRELTGPSQAVAVTVFSSESVEYYTPSEYIEATREVMGDIDLDPASCKAAQEVIGATQYYTKEDNGLEQAWEGRVWLNPPYGKIGNESSQGHWGQKLLDEYRDGDVSEAILLVKAATGYEWFEKLWDELPVCFARERISFIRENGDNDGSSKQGTAFFYLGENIDQFIDVFTQFGRIVLPGDQR